MFRKRMNSLRALNVELNQLVRVVTDHWTSNIPLAARFKVHTVLYLSHTRVSGLNPARGTKIWTLVRKFS